MIITANIGRSAELETVSTYRNVLIHGLQVLNKSRSPASFLRWNQLSKCSTHLQLHIKEAAFCFLNDLSQARGCTVAVVWVVLVGMCPASPLQVCPAALLAGIAAVAAVAIAAAVAAATVPETGNDHGLGMRLCVEVMLM